MSGLKPFDFLRVRPDEKIRLSRIKAGSTAHLPGRKKVDARTTKAVAQIGVYQDVLYAAASQALLVVLQGMDAAGKDGTVRRVFDAVNPTGCQVVSFKSPSAEEIHHDFLWRVHQKVPALGHIGVFNRSHYEDVLIVRVHAGHLLPAALRDEKALWPHRYRMIRDFEWMLSDSGTRVVKFFLHISRDEQRRRFESRQHDPTKNWKLAEGDFAERKYWDDYQEAYTKMLPATSTDHAPWYIIPADHKWVRNYYVAHIVCAILRQMHLQMPVLEDKTLVEKKFK